MSNKKYSEFTAGTPDGNDVILFADPTTGALEKVTLDGLNTAVGVIKRVKITKTFADFADASGSKSIGSGFTLPAGGLIHDIQINPTVTFSGGSISLYNISAGVTGNTGKWVNGKSVFTGSTPAKIVPGTSSLHSMSTPVEILLLAVSGGGNLDTATQGTVDIWFYYSDLD